MKDEYFYEDFSPGDRFASGSITLSHEDVLGFAHAYDPQYIHIDEVQAQQGPYGRLIASGWQTAAVTMRLKLDTPLARAAGGLIGLGVESLKWPRAVYPQDALRIEVTVLEKRESRSNPAKGIMKYRVETFNQHGEPVMEMVTAVLLPRR